MYKTLKTFCATLIKTTERQREKEKENNSNLLFIIFVNFPTKVSTQYLTLILLLMLWQMEDSFFSPFPAHPNQPLKTQSLTTKQTVNEKKTKK